LILVSLLISARLTTNLSSKPAYDAPTAAAAGQ
jgi:hypothetical protein